MIYGVDMSVWQGTINWRALSSYFDSEEDGRPIDFVMLRTEDGMGKDGRFDEYCMGLNGLGFYDLGTYFFFRAHLPVHSQVAQAVAMHGDLPGPIACDMETLDGIDPHLAADAALEALEGVAIMSGRKPMLYTDVGDWSRLGAWGKQAEFQSYPLWLAAVTEDPTKKTFVPPPWKDAQMRQYTFSRKITGVSANVDGDVFMGDIAAWRDVGR